MRAAFVLCLLAFVLSACGAAPRDSAQEFSGAERDVATAVEDIEEAARKNDSGALCKRLLSASLLAELKKKGTDCATAVKGAFEDADSLDLTVDDVAISGSTATAKVTSQVGSNKKTDTLELEKVGAAWKILLLRS
ncbi:MAG: nuclear transport factor 2 family protein [Solirubrobacteraceae bacterium]